MTALHSGLFIAHIILGSMALILFWIPILTKKGSLDHVKFGRYYGNVMYLVALSGALMALLVMYAPLEIKGHLFTNATDVGQLSFSIRVFWGFLLFLSLLTYVSVRQGSAVLKHKQTPEALRAITHLAPIVLLLVGGVFMFAIGIVYGRTLHWIFGLLGVGISASMLRYCLRKQHTQGGWIVEHLSAMIGSGIGAYTAFIAFGGRQLFENLGQLQLIFWIAPGVVGSIAIHFMSRKYQQPMSNNKVSPN